MKLHRFYVADKLELNTSVWINDEALLHQWTKVLRFRVDQQFVLFDSDKREKLYKIDTIEPKAIHLKLVTEMEPKIPSSNVYLCFSLLKKDKNEWVMQKCTELGIKHFIPIISSRTEKTGFDVERAKKIVIEASEQCGRTDIPKIREPINLDTAIIELSKNAKLFVAEQDGTPASSIDIENQEIAVFVGPEGGWTDEEKSLFNSENVEKISISDHTLRAETASVSVATILNSVRPVN